MFGDYYLGLDIGTDSVGWAVTDTNYNILEYRRKAMWGIHLFDSGNTAEERRIHRCSRRRIERRNQRIALLQDLFDRDISAVDNSFFERLTESKYLIEDRKQKQPNTLFNDPNFQDKDLHKKYPTIYHLRYDLMTSEGKPDIRLVYLAAHNIIKYRGHFLFEGLSEDSSFPDFEEVFSNLVSVLDEECGIELILNSSVEEFKNLLMDRKIGVREKGKLIGNLFLDPTEQMRTISTLLAGSTVALEKIFIDVETKEKISFKSGDFDEKITELEDVIGIEKISVLSLLKQIYDWSVLSSFLSGSKYISEAKIKQYDQHKADLRVLKSVMKYLDIQRKDGKKDIYNKVFRSDAESSNYCHYVGMMKKGRKNISLKKCSQEDFCKFLRNIIKDKTIPEDKFTEDMRRRIDEDTFMPKQTSKDNSVFPNALHRNELRLILENASKHYRFLNDKDSSGTTVKEKILLLCTFRIPYYVGPLNLGAKNKWAVRKGDGKITPWNFEKMVDIDKTSTAFIENLTSKCTYLPWEKVIPKNSLIYSRFSLYNELNKVRINNDLIEPKLKKDIVDDLFVNIKVPKKITIKALRDYIATKTGIKDAEITGLDKEIKTVLKSEVQIANLIGDKMSNHKMVEEIIRAITIFGDDPSRLKLKLRTDFKDRLTDVEINNLARLKYQDWGRLSEQFLTGIYHTWDGGVKMNILTALEQTNNNLMELLSNKYSYLSQIDDLKKKYLGESDGKISIDLVENLYCSPAVKRGIWRSLRVVQDILKIMGNQPKKIFIETTREDSEKKSTESRKKKLIDLYVACKNDERDWVGQIEGMEEGRFRGKKLYAYYTQMGRCMYCGRPFDLNDLGNKEICDMDHIYPQSKTTDDSVHNNMVLVCKTCNMIKTNKYPVPEEWQKKMCQHWSYLLKCNLINEEKYKRLTRMSGFTDEELSGFIARQLVETNQSVKAVAEVLGEVFAKNSDIVYVKANAVSRFRQSHDFIKCRSVNDYHHAKDAYLNIVVGNVYDVKFTKDPLNVIRKNEQYNLNKVFDYNVSRNGVNAWVAGENGTYSTVSKYMRRNNIAYTRSPVIVTGQLYDVTIMEKGIGQQPIKNNMPIEKYGGYNKVSGGFFSLVEHTVKKKIVRTIESVPVMYNSLSNDYNGLTEYFKTVVGLVEPKIIVATIRKNTFFEINGLRVSITGRTGSSILCMCGKQLILPYDIHDYCKKIYKYIEGRKESKGRFSIIDYDLDAERNIKTYDVLLSKLKTEYNSISILATQSKTLEELRPKFIESPVDVQSRIINEVLHLFQCNPMGMNISEIGGPSNAGRIIITNNVLSFDSFKMIAQSPSGMYEKEVDLKTL